MTGERSTPSQLAVLRLRCAGRTTRETAAVLGIAVVTAKNRMAEIRSRIGERSLPELCRGLEGDGRAGRPSE